MLTYESSEIPEGILPSSTSLIIPPANPVMAARTITRKYLAYVQLPLSHQSLQMPWFQIDQEIELDSKPKKYLLQSSYPILHLDCLGTHTIRYKYS